jgi:hypothetical protein
LNSSLPHTGISVTQRDDRSAVSSRILVCWQLSDRRGVQVTCELSRTDRGLQLQCRDTGQAEAIRAATVATVADGVALAQVWKKAYDAAGGAARETGRPQTILERRAAKRVSGDLRRVPD